MWTKLTQKCFLHTVVSLTSKNLDIQTLVLCQFGVGTSCRGLQNVRHFSSALTFHKLLLTIQIDRREKKMDPAKFRVDTAILRYQLGSERFQFSFKLSSGRSFNFDRTATETLEAFQERIVSNMKKKYRDADISVNFSLPDQYRISEPLKPLLDFVVNAAPDLFFEVNGEGGKAISINPPEIFAIKFHGKAFVNFPVHPGKIDATPNFTPDLSMFRWEFARVDEQGGVMQSKLPKQKQPNTAINWTPCATNSMIFFPEENLEGSRIRLVCTPSDGKALGEPFIAEHPDHVAKLPVKKLLYEELASKLHPIDSENPEVLRVMSYNVLADTYTTPEWFNNSPIEALDYSYRLPLLEKEITAYGADIICLQEVDEKAFKWDLEPFLRKSRQMVGSFSCKYGNTREGVASFINPAKLVRVEVDTIKITEAMKSTPIWTHLENIEPLRTRLEDRNTVLQISVLESRTADKSLIVLGVTHLYFHPTADHIRLLQTIICVQHIETKVNDLKKKFPGRKIRVLFAGDFNCTPPYSSCRFLRTGDVKEDDPDWVSCEAEQVIPGMNYSHNLNLRPSHESEALTNITLNFEGCIDYIFYEENSFELLKEYPPPDKASIAKITGCQEHQVSLPNLIAPSDHLPLIADFKLT